MEGTSSQDGAGFRRQTKVRKTLTKAFSKDLRTPENLGDDKNESNSPKKGEGAFTGLVAAGRLQARRRAGRSPTTLLRLGSGLFDDEPPAQSLSSPEAPKSPTSSASLGSFRRMRRSVTTAVQGIPGIGPEENEGQGTPSASGTSRLMMLNSAVSMLQQAVKDKVEDVAVGDPNEVILESDDSDDEENEEIERDFVSALQRVQDSGRLSIHELRVFEKELKEAAPILFEEESDMTILAGLQNARYLEVKCDDVLWSRYSELYSGILSCQSPICILVKGRVSVAKPGIPEGVKVLKGSVVNACDPDVLGIIALEPCKLMYVDTAQVEEDMDRAKTAWSRVDHNLRKKRPTSTWPEDLLDDLLLCVRHMPFFDNFDDRTLRFILRNVRFQCMPEGESLPPREFVTGTASAGSRPESHLVMFWEGKAGKYKRVQSADQRMISAQLEMMALEGLGKRNNRGPVSPQDMPELDETVAVDTKDSKIYLKRYGNLRSGAVLGERDLIDPGGPETGQPIVRCESPCYVLTLCRADYLHCLKEQQVERMRVVHALRNVAASRPGEPHHRSPEQLSLLAKLVRNTPELKNFDQDALMQVLGAATFISAAPGHILCHQGEVGDRFFAIIEGMVSIHVRPKTEIESALATAAESKGSGAGLIKTMLAALSHHRAEEAKKEKEKPAARPPIQSSPSVASSSDFSRAPSFVSDGVSPSPSLSPRDKGASPRKKPAKVSFGGEEGPKEAKEAEHSQHTVPTPLSPQIVVAVADGDDDFDPLTSPLMSPVSSSRSQDEEAGGSAPSAPLMTRRKSLKDRLRGGLFWSGIKKRLSSSPSTPAVRDLGKMVNRMGPGAAFGAKTLLKKDARTASVQTVEPTKMLVVTREDYVGLIGSMEEARAREAAEFLCRHVLMVEVRASSNRALDNLHPALRQRMARTSKAMTSHSLDRGMVLLTHGTETSGTVNILRKGSLAFCYPNEQQGCPDRWYRSNRACMNPSQVVSTPGELVGVHKALLDCTEPATVRVESAYCEVYRVPWTELQRVLTSRVLSMMKDKLQRCHALRSGVAATRSPKDMLTVAASSSIVGAAPSREQQAVKDALENAFSAACSFEAGESHSETKWNRPQKPQKPQRPQSHRSYRGAPSKPKVGSPNSEEPQFEENLAKAVAKLKSTTAQADLWESLRTGEADAVHAIPSLPPPITSDAHVRARFFKVLKDDPGMLGMEKFLTDCMLDPEKVNLNAWIKKYTSSEKLRKHSELQSLQMILRKQVKNPARLARSPT